MADMSTHEMVELMQMEDDAPFALVLLDQLEWRGAGDAEDAQALELQAYYGGDYHKAWLEAELERFDGEVEGRIEALWDRIVSPWWSLQAGVRHDLHEQTPRTWGSIGVQGLAPYFFEIDAAIYVGEQGRTAARLSVEYEWLLTQRLVLQPELVGDSRTLPLSIFRYGPGRHPHSIRLVNRFATARGSKRYALQDGVGGRRCKAPPRGPSPSRRNRSPTRGDPLPEGC